MPNVWGEDETGNGLQNPLTEDLLAAGFNALDFNEIHLNELHNNTGTGNIVVHEQFNMTNNRITNLDDPVAGKDAVTLDYFESNIPSPYIPYDLYFAPTNETSLIPAGNTVQYTAPRQFTVETFKCFLTTPVTNFWTVTVVFNGTFVPAYVSTFNAGDKVGTIYNFPAGTVIPIDTTIDFGVTPADASATGLKCILLGKFV